MENKNIDSRVVGKKETRLNDDIAEALGTFDAQLPAWKRSRKDEVRMSGSRASSPSAEESLRSFVHDTRSRSGSNGGGEHEHGHDYGAAVRCSDREESELEWRRWQERMVAADETPAERKAKKAQKREELVLKVVLKEDARPRSSDDAMAAVVGVEEPVVPSPTPSPLPRLVTEAICWKALQGSEEQRRMVAASCQCDRLHLPLEICPKHVGHILQKSKACERKGCLAAIKVNATTGGGAVHPPAEGILTSVLKWFGPSYTLQSSPEEDSEATRNNNKNDDDTSTVTNNNNSMYSSKTTGSLLKAEQDLLAVSLPQPGDTMSERSWRRKDGAAEIGGATDRIDDSISGNDDLQQQVSFWQNQAKEKFPTDAVGKQHQQYQHHFEALWQEPWLPQLLASPWCHKLLHCPSKKSMLKEFSEGYGVLRAVRAARQRRSSGSLRSSPNEGNTSSPHVDVDLGQGAVILDVCCGKGIGALMLAAALPHAKVIALDANTKMDLAHFQACPPPAAAAVAGNSSGGNGGLEFRLMDVFSNVFPATVLQSMQGEGVEWGGLVGTHLCGALSPRLVSVFRRCLDRVDCMVLSPCCLKGWGGKEAQKRAKLNGVEAYPQLCTDLCGLCLGGGGSSLLIAPSLAHLDEELVATVEEDLGIVSARNRLIIAERRRRGKMVGE